MGDPVRYEVRGGVAVITLDSPPVNGLGNAVRAGIVRGLQQAEQDAAVRAIVVIGSAKAFSGGADIREFNQPPQAPLLPDVNDEQDRAGKLLLAAIGGFALGGGLELALACHYRIAAPGAQLGLPEVKLGLLPGSGGTQRLPRLVPMAEAAQMMLTGQPVDAEAAAALGLVDAICPGALLEGAVEFAQRLLGDGKGPRRTSALPVRFEGEATPFFAALREKVGRDFRGYPAPLEIVSCLEAAATLPFARGREVERAGFLRLVASPESKALRHAFFAEREAGKIPGLAEDTPPRKIERAAVIGAGTMGGGIAMSFADAGIPVTLIEADAEPLERGRARIAKNYAGSVAKGRLGQAEMDRRLALITPAVGLAAASEADIVVEAVFEQMDVKLEVFRALDAIARPGAILATNTSTLDVDVIAAATGRPRDVLGTHFFSPANVMRLLEVVRGEATADDVLATAMKLGKRLKKVAVVSGVCDGFIGNRMLEKYSQQALLLLDEGASPQQVDAALRQFGMAMGPFAVFDLAGNDIGWEIRKRRARERGVAAAPNVADALCEQGRFGQKTGRGWYRYEEGGRQPLPDPEVDALLAEHRRRSGVQPRAIADQEIVERCVYALVNEGAAILEEGIAQRSSDIDVVYLSGYGFPPFRGGPMFYAGTVGLARVLEAVERFRAGHRGDLWTPAPLLRRLASTNATFEGGSRQA